MSETSPTDWAFRARQGGEEFRWKRLDGEIAAEWVGILSIRIDRLGNVVEMVPDRAAPAATVDKIATGLARAFARSMVGSPSLHASGIAVGSRGVACIGPSGVGKSTIAAGLCSRVDVAFIADDVMCLERIDGGWWALPMESHLWLSGLETTGKRPTTPRMTSRTPLALAAIVRLRFAESVVAPTLRRLKATDAFAAVTESLLRFEPTATRWREEFGIAAGLVDTVPVYELLRPRQLATAMESEAALLHLLGAQR